MISREEAYKLVTTWTENKNLVKHMLCVEAAMGGLAKHFKEDENGATRERGYFCASRSLVDAEKTRYCVEFGRKKDDNVRDKKTLTAKYYPWFFKAIIYALALVHL